jgi:hypothetical protein
MALTTTVAIVCSGDEGLPELAQSGHVTCRFRRRNVHLLCESDTSSPLPGFLRLKASVQEW